MKMDVKTLKIPAPSKEEDIRRLLAETREAASDKKAFHEHPVKKKIPLHEALEATARSIRDRFRKHLSLVRTILSEEPDLLISLELHTLTLSGNLFAELPDARRFYEKLLLPKADVLEKLNRSEYGLSKQELEACLAEAKKLENNRFWLKKARQHFLELQRISREANERMAMQDARVDNHLREMWKDAPEYLETLGIDQ